MSEKLPVKVLILPKFEIGEITGDAPGEAQFYYDGYLKGGSEYEVRGASTLYYKDEVALCITGMGKANQAASLMAILLDSRFDFSEAYIFSTGCAGGAIQTTVMGDVVLGTATVDFDMGHHIDPRDLTAPRDVFWLREPMFDAMAYKILDSNLNERIYNLIKDVKVRTTPMTREFMKDTFAGEDWAVRDPKVVKGTIFSGDNYWKGLYDHMTCEYMSQEYGCPDSFAASEMEDHVLALVADRMGMLDRYFVLRGIVNMAVYMNGATPEFLWASGVDKSLLSDDKAEAADIFDIVMENNYDVGRVVIDAILAGKL